MLERWMPFGTFEAANPVFRFGVRRLRWGRSPATLNRRGLTVSVVIATILLALWLLSLVSTYGAVSCSVFTSFSSCYYALSSASANFATVIALGTIGFDVLLDLACILAGYNTMRMNAEATHWDLLRMTPMRVETIVGAQHAVAQTRAWLMTTLLTAARVTIVCIYLVTLLVLPLLAGRSFGDLFGSGYGLSGLFMAVALAIIALVFMVEPIWRMRAMTALGVALASRFKDAVLGTLAGLGSVLALWLIELILLGIMFAMTIWVGANLTWYFAPIFGAILGAVVIRWFFGFVVNRSLGRAIRYVTPG